MWNIKYELKKDGLKEAQDLWLELMIEENNFQIIHQNNKPLKKVWECIDLLNKRINFLVSDHYYLLIKTDIFFVC